MTTYKNQSTGEVISAECYYKLPINKRQMFVAVTNEPATHHYDDYCDDLLAGAIIGSVIDDMASDSSFGYSPSNSDDMTSSSSDSFDGFGGGDTGGGGTGGEW